MDTGQTKIEKTKNNYLIIQFFSVLSRVVLHQIFYSWGHPVEGSTENDQHQKMINITSTFSRNYFGTSLPILPDV